MFGSVSMDMYLPALPAMAKDLHASPAAAQATVSTFLLGQAVGQLVVGPLSDRLGRRIPVMAGVTLFCVATGLCAISSDVGLLVAARLLQALGACGGSLVARAVVRDRYDDHEVLHVFSLLSLVFGVCPVLAPLLGGWVLTVADWRWIFGVQALFGLAVGAAVFLRLPESRSEATRLRAYGENPFESYLALLRQPLLVGYLLTGGLAGAALFSYITSAPRLIITELHVSPAHFGWVFGVNAVGLIAGNQVNARLARRIPSDTLVQAALLSALAAAVALAACAWTGWGGVWGLLLPLFVVIASLGFSQPNTTASAMNVDRHRAGATAALVGTAFFGVGSLAGVATSLVPGRASQAMAAVILATLALALASYYALVTPQLRRSETKVV
jgi:DHA1 family bicyclomycin/chloramphenicol resistance-like MFS transporter